MANIKKNRFIFLIAIMLINNVAMSSENICKKRMEEVLETYSGNVVAQIENLNKIESECKDDEDYKYNLARLNILIEAYDEAKAIIIESLQDKAKYRKEFEAFQIMIAQRQIIDSEDNAESSWKEIEVMHKELIKKYPEWWQGYSNYAAYLLLFDRYEEVEKNLIKSIELEQTKHNIALLITLYHDTERNKEAVSLFDEWSTKDQSIYSSQYLMLIIARSYVDLGDFELAKKALILLADRNPKSKDTDDFKETVEYFNQNVVN